MKLSIANLLEYNESSLSTLLRFIEENNVSNEKINELLSHIINVQYIWLAVMKGESIKTKPWATNSMKELKENNSNLLEELLGILESVSLKKNIDFELQKGDEQRNSLEDIFLHVVQHGVHHKGQINLILRQLGHTPPALDYLYYVNSY